MHELPGRDALDVAVGLALHGTLDGATCGLLLSYPAIGPAWAFPWLLPHRPWQTTSARRKPP